MTQGAPSGEPRSLGDVVRTLLPQHGVHGPNSRMADAIHPWQRSAWTQARWIKLLYDSRYETHTRADAQRAREAGLRVLVRAAAGPDALMPDPGEVGHAIQEFTGLIEVLEVGNEPPTAPADGRSLWDHALRMEEIATHYTAAAHQAGMRLCPGGWTAGAAPPGQDSVGERLRAVYNQYGAIGVHSYDPGDLTAPDPQNHLVAWIAAFPAHPIYITEYGIAYRWLLRDVGVPATSDWDEPHALEKARRYARWLATLQPLPTVVAAFAFLVGGTPEWGEFDQGNNSYHLTDAAWSAIPLWAAHL